MAVSPEKPTPPDDEMRPEYDFRSMHGVERGKYFERYGRFLICVDNAGYPASLEVRKVYAALPDAEAESLAMVRIVDESGEDYVYPRALFVPVDLPQSAAQTVLAAISGESG